MKNSAKTYSCQPRHPHNYGIHQTSHSHSSTPPTVAVHGRALIPPNTTFARAVVMGNDISANDHTAYMHRAQQQQQQQQRVGYGRGDSPKRPVSNLAVLLNQQQQQQEAALPQQQQNEGLKQNPPVETPQMSSRQVESPRGHLDEADSASGPPSQPPLGSSAPVSSSLRYGSVTMASVPSSYLVRGVSVGGVAGAPPVTLSSSVSERVRRCMSSRELGTLAPPSGSPYAYMLFKKEALEITMRERLKAMRQGGPENRWRECDESSSNSSRRKEGTNEMRNRKRAEHNQAVVNDLCEVVADLFLAESKLLKPTTYGLDQPTSRLEREHVIKTVHNFVAALPARYALGADTPSEVLLHMRLMAAARSDKTKACLHIHNLDDDSHWSRTVTASSQKNQTMLRLVTLSCGDAFGLLEYITRLLATGGSRVLDADVMLSTDGIVLDRFVVEMNGRLRLDKLANLIEAFLKDYVARTSSDGSVGGNSNTEKPSPNRPTEPGGPLYVSPEETESRPPRDIMEEMELAVPLTEVLASSLNSDSVFGPDLPKLRRMHSMPNSSSAVTGVPNVQLSMRVDHEDRGMVSEFSDQNVHQSDAAGSTRRRRPLVNRRATSNLDSVGVEDSGDEHSLDYVTIPSYDVNAPQGVENRSIPLIPFDELMLIEAIGTGRVSTIYRAAWQRTSGKSNSGSNLSSVHMVALKVAMVNTITGDSSNVDELRREADIAARLRHSNVVDLVGVAADAECFCLAYDFCEGGSLLSLLLDASRYYEYLPIAMDVANGMAYLHSRNVIHRDLKPSNILLTRDHRAKIADFGMSVANAGQELTAETGTYRYMAPEVIRHESYSSNADVYSFGICLWQLITREIPFATMTPIQAAYAVAEGRRPEIPLSTPRRLQEIIMACWDQDSQKRPSFTYIAMALADYAKMAFSPANVGALTLQIANEMLANVEGNSTVNVDFSTPVATTPPMSYINGPISFSSNHDSVTSNVGLELEYE